MTIGLQTVPLAFLTRKPPQRRFDFKRGLGTTLDRFRALAGAKAAV